ncbi:MAG: heme o synthase [Alphaproteobacteria bacterium]
MFKSYFQLAKPGIVMGNLISGLGGFFYASQGGMYPDIFVGTMVGLILVIASACAFNNVYDMDIDKLMSRTQTRPMITGEISKTNALIFASIIGLIGFISLWVLSSKTAFYVGAFAFFIYVIAYTVWSKRQSTWGTFIGSFSGAVPPLLGYVSITDTIDTAGILIFVLYVIWQMPHSYAIAIFRLDDYKKAKINVLPVAKGFDRTRSSIMLHISAFVAVLALFGFMGYMHPIGLLFSLAMAVYWLATATFLYDNMKKEKWAKQIFFQSIFIVIVLNLCLGFNGLLNNL